MAADLPRCSETGVLLPECSCRACLERQFALYYARREARRLAAGEASPEQRGRLQAREQIARRG